MLKNYLLSPLCLASALQLSLFQPSFSFSFSASFLFSSLLVSSSIFLFSFPSTPVFFFLFFCFILLSLAPPPFLQTCCLFFSAQNLQPKTFFNSAQNVFASAQNLFQFTPKPFFSPKRFSACLWFSASFFSSFSAPLFFLLTCCPFLLLLFSLLFLRP